MKTGIDYSPLTVRGEKCVLRPKKKPKPVGDRIINSENCLSGVFCLSACLLAYLLACLLFCFSTRSAEITERVTVFEGQ